MMFSSTPRTVESATRSFEERDSSYSVTPASYSTFGRGIPPCMPADASSATTAGQSTATTAGPSTSYFSDITNIYKD